VSARSLDEGLVRGLGLTKQVSAVRRCRRIGKQDMKLNDALPTDLTVVSDEFMVYVNKQRLYCEPADRLPLAQRYSLF
jgi:urease subunit alpha